MDKNLQTYYENRFAMMATQGWADLLEDVSIMRESYSNILSIGTAEELQFRKGQLDILDWLLNLNYVSTTTYQELEKE